MRLSKNNIKHVNVHSRNGEIYEVSVALKSNRVSDLSIFTINTSLDLERIPACVKAFTQSHGCVRTSEMMIKGDNYITVKFS